MKFIIDTQTNKVEVRDEHDQYIVTYAINKWYDTYEISNDTLGLDLATANTFGEASGLIIDSELQ